MRRSASISEPPEYEVWSLKYFQGSRAQVNPQRGFPFKIGHSIYDHVSINWWIGGEMLQSLTFYTGFETPTEFQICPREGFMACVWEMEIIIFERAMWVEHILKNAEAPDYETYFGETMSNDGELS
jgi:hypothetical protein